MTLIQLLGDVGSGKTLFATYLALRETRPVYSNYKINIPNYHPLKPETLVRLNKPAMVVVDEAYRWTESRTSGRQLNRYMSYNLFQQRKRGLDYVLTDQLENTIDLRFRLMTDYEIQCQQIPEIGFVYRIFKHSAFKRYNPVDMVMPYEFAEKYLYGLFDSWEQQPLDEDMIFNITEDKSEIVKDIDKVSAHLLTQYPPKAITKGIVADYCLRNEYPKSYVEPIYNSIKATALKGVRRVAPKSEPTLRKPYTLRN